MTECTFRGIASQLLFQKVIMSAGLVRPRMTLVVNKLSYRRDWNEWVAVCFSFILDQSHLRHHLHGSSTLKILADDDYQ